MIKPPALITSEHPAPYVVLDTCILISNILRLFLLRLDQANYIRVFWSPIIADEWCRNTPKIWRQEPEVTHRIWHEMENNFPHANIGDISSFMEFIKKSDPKDRHVAAAARSVRVNHDIEPVALLTRNIKDFHRAELRTLGLSLYDPDRYLIECYKQWPDKVKELLNMIADDAVAIGREPEPLENVLRRERLFRLNQVIKLGITL